MRILEFKNFIPVILLLLYVPLHGQDISTYYVLSNKGPSEYIFVKDNLKVGFDAKQLGQKIKSKYLYSYNGIQKKDSLLLPKGTNWMSLGLGPVFFGDEIYFCISPAWQVIKIDVTNGKLSVNQSMDLKSDTMSICGDVDDKFIIHKWKRYLVQTYDPHSGKIQDIFDYKLSADEAYKKYIGTDDPVGVGHVFSFATGNKMLVKTGYNEAGASFDCIYYIANTESGLIKKLSSSHFEPLISEPKNNLKDQPNIRMDTFSIDIREMYFDVNDSVGYVPYQFYYDYKIDSNHTQSRLYRQDAFVINRDFELIGRALERNINIAYPIYNNGNKTWNVIYSNTDSLKNCFFRIKLNYSLEKNFYDLYYNKIIPERILKTFDKYELSLLKNFIFAKHNYKFDSPFYQAYFNTFTFYFDEDRRKSRSKNIDRLLTQSDKINLSSITKKLK